MIILILLWLTINTYYYWSISCVLMSLIAKVISNWSSSRPIFLLSFLAFITTMISWVYEFNSFFPFVFLFLSFPTSLNFLSPLACTKAHFLSFFWDLRFVRSEWFLKLRLGVKCCFTREKKENKIIEAIYEYAKRREREREKEYRKGDGEKREIRTIRILTVLN